MNLNEDNKKEKEGKTPAVAGSRVGEVFGKFRKVREEMNGDRADTARRPGRNAREKKLTNAYIRTNGGEEEEKGLNIV